MKLPQAFLFLLTLFTTIHALALPASFDAISDSAKELFKRKGGGGGGGKGGGGGGSKGGSGTTNSGSPGRTGSTANTGGQTSRGSGPAPSYGGGSGPRYYAGGAAVPYTAGATRSGARAPLLIGGAGLVAFPFIGLGIYGLYAYPYAHPWYYYNRTSNRNETHPVDCICAQGSTCGCDPSNNSTDYINSVANNASVAKVANINGTDTLVVNGSLPNGTTAAGGSDSAASGLKDSAMQAFGYWPVVAGVAYTVWFM